MNLPAFEEGDVLNGAFLLTNYGLVRADNLQIAFPAPDGFLQFETLAEFPTSLEANETIANSFRFGGQHGVMDDGNGLHYMRARYYDAELGRFFQVDPIGFPGGDLNPYRFVHNRPTDLVDPLGAATRPAPDDEVEHVEPLPAMPGIGLAAATRLGDAYPLRTSSAS